MIIDLKAKYPLEYYIHYYNSDKGEDEWVHEGQIEISENQHADLISENSEEENKDKKLTMDKEMHKSYAPRKSKRLQRSEEKDIDERDLKWIKEHSKFRTIEHIYIHGGSSRASYFSPYPENCHGLDLLYIWDRWLQYFINPEKFEEHQEEWKFTHSKENLIYITEEHVVAEVDGENAKEFCIHLWLLSKLFINCKNLIVDITSFYYYCLYKNTSEQEYQFLGYFSKHKDYFKPSKPKFNENVSCLLILPSCQAKGYGKFLIDLSYQLSLKDKKSGTPARPLSSAGFNAYRNWWISQIDSNLSIPKPKTFWYINDIVAKTGISSQDIKDILSSIHVHVEQGSKATEGALRFKKKEFVSELEKANIKINTAKPKFPFIQKCLSYNSHRISKEK